jgi:Carboxypeptidase regulatory-like domain
MRVALKQLCDLGRAVLIGTACIAGLPPAAAWAQVDTGSVAGSIVDESGASLPGVTITVTHLSTQATRTTVSNEVGRYQITALPPSRYSIKAELQGFATIVRPDVTVNVGSAVDVNLMMKVSTLEETVTVTGEAPLIESTRADLSNVITTEQLESLPSKGRQYLDFTLLLPATVENTSTLAQGAGVNVGGARGKEAALLVDGFYNLDEGFAKPKQRHSQDAIQEFQVISFGGSAEHGRAIGGIVNAVTKAGGNQLHGSGYGYYRGTALNAQDFGEARRGAPKAPFTRQQWGGTFGGPIKRDKSFFFGAYERIKEDYSFDNGILSQDAALLGIPNDDVGTMPRYYYLNFAMGKWDHNINDNHRLQASVALSRWTEFSVSTPISFGTRSRQYGLRAPDWLVLGKWTGIAAGGRVLHEVKGAYFPRYYEVYGLSAGGPPLVPDGQINMGPQSNASPPRVTISSVASFGSANLNNKIDTFPAQALYSTTYFIDKHTIKFGADYMTSLYDYTLYSPLTGNYTFTGLQTFQNGVYSQYTQTFGDTHNPRWHQYLSAFVQDSWLVNRRLTVNYGARFDMEVHPKHNPSGERFGHDYNNIGPRFAISYDLTGRGTTFVKVASGIYYDRLFQNLTTFYTSVKGYEKSVSATWTPTSPGAPRYPNVFPTPPPNLPRSVVNTNILPDKLRTPASGQVVATFEQALNPGLVFSVSGVYTRSWDKEYLLDTNLVFNDQTQQWTRPDPDYRAINQYQFGGSAEYYAGILELTNRGSRFGYSGNLTVARAYDTGNNYNSAPQDQRLGIESEWGPQADTPTVRGVVNGWYNITTAMQISAIYRARTGTAITAVASGIDLNGDGNTGDRTPGFGRNSFRMTGQRALDLRFAWTLPVGTAKRVQMYVEGFNVLNDENVRTVVNDYGPIPDSPRPRWMEAVTFFPPREVQLGARLSF